MATSRTGTATWKRVSRQAKKTARANGQTRCPYCGTTLDYDVGLKPNSAEADHVIPHSKGGRDTIDNCIVCCRRCNQSKGNRMAPKASTVLAAKPLKTSRRW
ncbi:HNH endonuclease [Arthrobacter sp. FW306-2-2C-D06B]|uniref:HNH endonuclease n=1 Tax=Arthrobacter sp. FW306-2-2C-D06B TaxID=2879618 RepID=UPI003FA4B1B0|nr:HNH endonuclease [Arthrobacter sp. FW306-2-2C-D06B]